MTSNLEKVQASLAEVEAASAQLRSRVAQLESPHGNEDAGEDLALPTMYEVARALRRASDELCYFIAAETLDRGDSPGLLDWNSG